MEYNIKLVKNIFHLTLFAGCYFLLAFTGVMHQADSELIGGLFELLTIPLILSLVFVVVFSLYQLFIKHIKLTFYSLASLTISVVVLVAMFFVK